MRRKRRTREFWTYLARRIILQPDTGDKLLLEAGDDILLESGDSILVEE